MTGASLRVDWLIYDAVTGFDDLYRAARASKIRAVFSDPEQHDEEQ